MGYLLPKPRYLLLQCSSCKSGISNGNINKGAKYGTLNFAMAAVANILDYSIANNEIISTFFHAINQFCPPLPKYNQHG